jgi:HTH-type transcriptional regulator / antitoxin HigA
MEPKVIKTEEEYQAALAYLNSLMGAAPGSPEEQELELFSVLIEKYEDENFPIGLPDPIEAIKFRMDQQGLTRKDLIPYFGSQSKVSEVLNGKRPLSISMMRSLHEGFGIPAEVLLQEPGRDLNPPAYRWQDYPFAELVRQGYFKGFEGSLQEAKRYAEELLGNLFANFQGNAQEPVLCRSAEGEQDVNALTAWQARALDLVFEQDLPPYDATLLNEGVVRELVKLSKFEQGPVLARELLQRIGIAFVILKHLPQTYLDGACFKSPGGRPVVGLTLRHDRLDNFWFTLVHELVHIHLHLGQNNISFFDDTEHAAKEGCTPQELEANEMANQWLIPQEIWGQVVETLTNEQDIRNFAFGLGISPAIVAGRIRWEANDFKIFSGLLGHRTVRILFGIEN